MDRLNEYRRVIKRVLTEFAEWANRTPPPEEETICVLDEEHDYYLLLNVHWSRYRCVRGAQVFVRIRNCKFWIEEDWTEHGIATDLLEAGVPKEDIVLAFHPPEMRHLTEFAAA